MFILAYFSKDLTTHALIFRVFGRKTIAWEILEKILKIFDENSKEKLDFYLFLGKLLLKLEHSEIISFLYNIFFQLRGVEPPYPSAYATPISLESGQIANFKRSESPVDE